LDASGQVFVNGKISQCERDLMSAEKYRLTEEKSRMEVKVVSTYTSFAK